MARSLSVRQTHAWDYLLIQANELVMFGFAFSVDTVLARHVFENAFSLILDVSAEDSSCQFNGWALVLKAGRMLNLIAADFKQCKFLFEHTWY